MRFGPENVTGLARSDQMGVSEDVQAIDLNQNGCMIDVGRAKPLSDARWNRFSSWIFARLRPISFLPKTGKEEFKNGGPAVSLASRL